MRMNEEMCWITPSLLWTASAADAASIRLAQVLPARLLSLALTGNVQFETPALHLNAQLFKVRAGHCVAVC